MDMEHPERLDDYPEIQRAELIESELRRIEEVLRAKFSPEDTAEIVEQFERWALEIDEITDRIKNHPAVRGKFSYDGEAFEKHDSGGDTWHALKNGLNFLRDINAGIVDAIFRIAPRTAKKELLSWVEEAFVKDPRIRIFNLESTGSMGRVPPEVMEGIVASIPEEEKLRAKYTAQKQKQEEAEEVGTVIDDLERQMKGFSSEETK